jgi:hypothetical protein
VQSKTPTQGKRPVCYYCGKVGHIQRNCFAQENSKRKSVKATTSRSRLAARNKKIVGLIMQSSPCVEAQVGKLHLQVLIDSGSARSLISFRDYQNLNLGGQVAEVTPVDVTCANASGDSLAIVGETLVKIKIQGFSWTWKFLVSKKLQRQPILGVDFITRNKLVLDIGTMKCHFGFAPRVQVPLIMPKGSVKCSQTTLRLGRFPNVRCGSLNPQQRGRLENLIHNYPDVLTEKLGLTHLLEYNIQLLEKTPVRLAPYRLAPPKMKIRRERNKSTPTNGAT